MNFKGFNDWIEIFKGGTQTDSAGRKHDGDEVINKIISTFKPSDHEPPIVIGHSKNDAPAYGWVEDLKTEIKNGVKILSAKFKQVIPAFQDMVKKGLFKKRSISVYPDGSLRHVAFLGATPPAVKGLENLNWNEVENATNFSCSTEEACNDFQDNEIAADIEASRRILRHIDAKFMEADTPGFTQDNEAVADFKTASRLLKHLHIETSFKDHEQDPDEDTANRILRHLDVSFKDSETRVLKQDDEALKDIDAANQILWFANKLTN